LRDPTVEQPVTTAVVNKIKGMKVLMFLTITEHKEAREFMSTGSEQQELLGAVCATPSRKGFKPRLALKILLPTVPGRVMDTSELGGCGQLARLMKSRALFAVQCFVGAAVAVVDALAMFQRTAPV